MSKEIQARPPVHIVIVGHVDHGKSTLIGRLLHDTDSLPPGKVEELKVVSERRGMPLEWSFVLDSFQAERDQAVTIDTTQIRLHSGKREVVIIDAPGHREFLKNMISGASLADAAVLVVDATEGVREQTRRHAYLLPLLGLRQVAVVVNKMDMVGHAASRFAEVAGEVRTYLADIGVEPRVIVPISARHGDNIAAHSEAMDWYDGPTLLETIDGFAPRPPAVDRPLRFPVQDVYRFDERRILVGRIESGVLRLGDQVVFSPSNRTATVISIEAWGAPVSPVQVQAGLSVGITLDQPIFVERGDLASHVESGPVLSNVFRATVFWLADRPLMVGATYKLKLATREAVVSVQSIERVIDTQSLAGDKAEKVSRNEMAEVVFRARELLALDSYHSHPETGRCVLVDRYDIVGGGVINLDGYPDQRRHLTVKSDNLFQVEHLLTPEARARRNGHKGAVVWFTGLSGAGKSTLAMALEQRLFAKGAHVYVLDGDNVRRGLNSDLGFSPDDRAENIRRVGEAAALFADSGCVVVTAFISPYQADRDRAREAAQRIGASFHEIHVKAGLEICERRDPKGLYKKARAGGIRDFTGISSPYEPPTAPEMVVDTEAHDVETCVEQVLTYIEAAVRL